MFLFSMLNLQDMFDSRLQIVEVEGYK